MQKPNAYGLAVKQKTDISKTSCTPKQILGVKLHKNILTISTRISLTIERSEYQTRKYFTLSYV